MRAGNRNRVHRKTGISTKIHNRDATAGSDCTFSYFFLIFFLMGSGNRGLGIGYGKVGRDRTVSLGWRLGLFSSFFRSFACFHEFFF